MSRSVLLLVVSCLSLAGHSSRPPMPPAGGNQIPSVAGAEPAAFDPQSATCDVGKRCRDGNVTEALAGPDAVEHVEPRLGQPLAQESPAENCLVSDTLPTTADDEVEPPCQTAKAGIDWQTDYGEAMRIAKAQHKMMFVWFHGALQGPFGERFEAASLGDAKVRNLLDRYIAVKLPQDAKITVDGRQIRLLDHAAFQELNRSPGIAIIDFENPQAEHYGYVVNTLPFTPGKYYRFRREHLAVVLDLPPGTLTQRTLVFAVRIHPEKPASTRGKIDATLVREANSHSTYQARIRVQGHHHWGQRFPRISRLLFGLRPQEIVAESWPQEGLVDAAVDVVDSWHHSSGHWQAVYSSQNRFGYDMQKGSNGIWYATGLFGNNR